MRSGRSIKRPRRTSAGARRLRDLLRAGILESSAPQGHLPSELELMVAYGATREMVREALVLLRREGIINRVQGRGTFVTAVPSRLDLAAVVGRPPRAGGHDAGAKRPVRRELERVIVSVPTPIANRLDAAPLGRCERVEYLLELDAIPIALVTEYLPSAGDSAARPASSERWLGERAVGEQPATIESSVGCVAADDAVARLLGIAEGAPVLVVEQQHRESAGRAVSYAVMYVRPDRVVLRSGEFERALASG